MKIRKSTEADLARMMDKLGFEKRGIIHVVEDNYPRFAYEKKEANI